METKRSFKAGRALAGLAMILVGAAVIYWELFEHSGRIRVIGLLAAFAVGIVGGIAVLVQSLATVCARCGTEIDATELAFPEGHLPAAQAYAANGGAAEHLWHAPKVRAEDQRRAILALDGCNTCRVFTRVAAHLAVWSGSYFEAQHRSAWRPVDPREAQTLSSLLQSRM
jgi:hypothetical protein